MKFIIVGAGNVGISLAKKLVTDKHDVIIVEKNPDNVSNDTSSIDAHVVFGNGCNPHLLTEIGIDTADFFISVADKDVVNISACFVAKFLNPKAKRIARIRKLSFQHKDIKQSDLNEYFDLIINPDQAAADYLVQLIKYPGAKEIIDFSDGLLRVVGLEISERSKLVNKRINTLKEHQVQFPFLLIALIRDDKLIVPRGKDEIKKGDLAYFIALPTNIHLLFDIAGVEYNESHSAMIWGGSSLATYLTHLLEDQGFKLKLLLSEPHMAELLADQFRHTLIINGSATDQQLLKEENVSSSTCFISASNDEEDNILAALLAKRLGARSSMAFINNPSYLPLVSAIGLDGAVSSRLAAARAIFKHIHAKSVVSEYSLRHWGASFLEIVAKEDMKIIDKPIKDLSLPQGILINAIVHEDHAVIPTGDSVITVGDQVVIFVLKTAKRKLEKILNEKLELLI